MMRRFSYEAAQVILTRTTKWSWESLAMNWPNAVAGKNHVALARAHLIMRCVCAMEGVHWTKETPGAP